MPRSIFLGRPWPEPGEPLWLDDDRAWALALIQHRADLCDGCGHPLSESTATRDGRPVHRYELDEPAVCYGCLAASAELPDWDDHAQRRAMRFQVIRKT